MAAADLPSMTLRVMVLVGAMAVAGVAGVGMAAAVDRAVGNPAPSAVATERLVNAEGRVTGMDGSGRVVFVAMGERVIPFEVADSTTVFLEGRLGGLDEVDVGTHVRAFYRVGSGTPVLEWLEVPRGPQPTSWRRL